ncbi:MAG: T9SS type A sorting domain-containing protein [Candidatus Krumholzibacteriia bacterium]
MFAYPTTDSGFVNHLAANFQRCINVASPGQRMRVTFNGADDGQMTLAAVVNESYTTHAGAFYEIPLGANNDVVFDVPYDLDGVYSIGFIVGNGEKAGTSKSYTITVDRITPDPTAVDELAPAFAIAGNFPNPFNPQTSIKFTLNGTAATSLEVFDVSGRKVRTLLDHVLDAGEHTVPFNGRDDAGQALPSGTYLAKLRSGDQVTTHKLVLAK